MNSKWKRRRRQNIMDANAFMKAFMRVPMKNENNNNNSNKFDAKTREWCILQWLAVAVIITTTTDEFSDKIIKKKHTKTLFTSIFDYKTTCLLHKLLQSSTVSNRRYISVLLRFFFNYFAKWSAWYVAGVL